MPSVMETNNVSSVEDVMQRSMHSFGGSIVVNMPEEPAISTVAEGRSPTLSDKEHSFFSGILDKFNFKTFNSALATAKETFDHRVLCSDVDREAFRHDEPLPTHIPIFDPIETTCLASKIRSLLKAFPLPSSSTSGSSKDSKELQHGNDESPILPHGVAQTDDARLAAMLQSETVMNGGQLGDDGRVSVWSVLESLGEDLDGNDVHGGSNEDGRMEDDVRQTSGIMMYSPLMPTNLSLVEIAESGVLDLEDEEQEQEQIVDTTSETTRVAGWMGMWPFSARSTSVTAGAEPRLTVGQSSPITTSFPCSPSGCTSRLDPQARKRVWIPSSTQLSFQAVWWGYRIYLPPPIMDALGDKSMEYAKRSMTITTALTWFFHNIPLAVLPVTVRPVVLLLQTLIPYIGCIGSLISWSWGTIQSYDTGHGVILTATWLLPVALIPSTWETNNFPPPSLPSPPAALTNTPRLDVPDHFPTEQYLSPAPSFVTALTSSLQSSAPAPFIYLAPTPFHSSPLHLSSANSTNTDVRNLSPIHFSSCYPSPSSPALLYAFQPLPPWVLPPPPPSPPTIPLPEIEEEENT